MSIIHHFSLFSAVLQSTSRGCLDFSKHSNVALFINSMHFKISNHCFETGHSVYTSSDIQGESWGVKLLECYLLPVSTVEFVCEGGDGVSELQGVCVSLGQ